MRKTSIWAGTLALVLLLAGPAIANAEIARDPSDTRGPLDLVRVKVGQKDTLLQARISVTRPLPQLTRLRDHPNFESSKPQRFLCLNLASHSIGRRFFCPAGRIKHGRIGVGVSVVGKRSIRGKGSVSAKLKRSKRGLLLDFKLGALGIKPGKLHFAAMSSWYGPACAPPSSRRTGATCSDRAPSKGSATTKIDRVQRVGCTGFHSHTVFRGPTKHKWVALTFDDGPSPYTDDVLRILDRNHVHGTFFQIGEQVPAYASLERKILAHGNELANHSMHHSSGPGESDLHQVNELIERATGFQPCMFRPPGGYLPSATSAAAAALHMVSVIWDVDTRDWTTPGSGAIYSEAVSGGKGSIVLMHDGGGDRSQTVAALPGVIKSYKKRGYKLKTMTQLLGGHYVQKEVNHHGRVWTPDLARPDTPIFRAGP
jgi:peptidoglycan/xylan/chitin deacetylase (PgdA/CDA1 family)